MMTEHDSVTSPHGASQKLQNQTIESLFDEQIFVQRNFKGASKGSRHFKCFLFLQRRRSNMLTYVLNAAPYG